MIFISFSSKSFLHLEQHKSFNQGYELTKAKYFIYLNEEIINLLPKKMKKIVLKNIRIL